jgi:hypothetical protein
VSAIARGPVPRAARESVPAAIERECTRSLAAAPEERHESARQFGDALLSAAAQVATRIATHEEVGRRVGEITDD